MSLLIFLAPNKFKVKFRRLKLGYELAIRDDSYLVQTGFIQSILDNSLNNNGNPIPWMNYPFIEFLEERLNKNHSVFEYGSGSSTLFFANRVKDVTSVEYDKNWFDKVTELLKGELNSSLHFTELNDEYPSTIERISNEKGVVIFDDSHREYYKEGLEFYLNNGYHQITFKGLKPTGFGIDQTTLLYKPANNCLSL